MLLAHGNKFKSVNSNVSCLLVDVSNKDSYSFNIETTSTIFNTFLMFGATSKIKPFMYLVFIDVEKTQREVTFTKIIDGHTSRAFTGTYSTEKQMLNINCDSLVYGGIRLIAIK